MATAYIEYPDIDSWTARTNDPEHGADEVIRLDCDQWLRLRTNTHDPE